MLPYGTHNNDLIFLRSSIFPRARLKHILPPRASSHQLRWDENEREEGRKLLFFGFILKLLSCDDSRALKEEEETGRRFFFFFFSFHISSNDGRVGEGDGRSCDAKISWLVFYAD